ncbi:MAG: DUF3108 domain-containing protein [Acidobacteriota bacterium]|nr:DUF3108 domain-containing protein [Acidobacteriota bacterium]
MKSPTQEIRAALIAHSLSTFFASVFAAMLIPIFLIGTTPVISAQQRPGSPTVTSRRATGSVRGPAFESGEELVYVAEFSRVFLKKVDVADFRFTAGRENLPRSIDSGSSRKAGDATYSLKFTGDVSSKGFFSKLFNLHFRERIESLVEPLSFTVQKTKRVDEQGKRSRTSESVYANGKVFWIERDPNNPARTPRSATANFTGQVQDVLSAIYFLRTQPLEIGKTFEVTVSDSGRVYQIPVRVLEKKRLKTVLGRVEALRLDPDVYGPNRMIAGEGQFTIWLTNDSRRIPVSARIKTSYGTFDITLRKVIENSRAPQYLTSH